jgi:hypothetical protein
MKRLRKYRKKYYSNNQHHPPQPRCEEIREDVSTYQTPEYKERYSSRLEKICSIIDEFLENDETDYYIDGSYRFDIMFEKKTNSKIVQRCSIVIYTDKIRIVNYDNSLNNMDEEFEIYNDFLFEKYYSIVEYKQNNKNLNKCDSIINSLMSLTTIKRKNIIDKLFDE